MSERSQHQHANAHYATSLYNSDEFSVLYMLGSATFPALGWMRLAVLTARGHLDPCAQVDNGSARSWASTQIKTIVACASTFFDADHGLHRVLEHIGTLV